LAVKNLYLIHVLLKNSNFFGLAFYNIFTILLKNTNGTHELTYKKGTKNGD